VLKIVENLWAVGLRPEPLGELSAPPDPIAGGKGVAAPSPITPSPLSAFGPSVLATH